MYLPELSSNTWVLLEDAWMAFPPRSAELVNLAYAGLVTYPSGKRAVVAVGAATKAVKIFDLCTGTH